MGMGVDDTRHHHAASGIGDDGGLAVDLTNDNDLSVADADVGDACGSTSAIDDGSALDDLVVHCVGHCDHLSSATRRRRF